MNLSTFCLKQREKEATAQKYLLLYALIGSSLVHLSAALGSNLVWQKNPEITEEPIEVIMVDAPKPEVKPPEPKPKAVKPPEIKPKPTPIPETKIVNIPTRPINPIQKPEPLKTTVKAPPRPPAEVAVPKPKPAATKPEPAPKRPVAAAPPLSNPPRKNPQVEEIGSTLNRTTTSPPKEDNEPVMTSPGTVVTGDVPVQKPVTNSAPIPSSSENVGQLRDSFGADDSSTNAANPGGTDEGSSTSNSPGDVAINQAPSKPAQESGGGDSEGSSEGGGGVRCISNCQPDYPSSITEKVEGRPVVRITIAENGNVVGSQLASSSGNSQLDQAAIASAKEMVFDPPGTQVAVRVAINFTLENSDFHQEALEREQQAQQEREQKEKERQAQLERERQAQLERDRKEKERQAQLQQERQEQQRQEALQRERQRVQQQRQQRIEQNSRQQQQRQQQSPGQQTQPQQPPNRLPSVFDERP